VLSQNLNLKPTQIKTVNQIHGDNICIVEDKNQDTSNIEADCIITNLKNICIGTKTADCIPVTIFDPVNEVIACIHLGRKSLLLGLLEKTINTLISKYNTNPKSLKVWIYPSLQQKNHSVPSSEGEKFPAEFVKYLPKGQHLHNNQVLYKEYLVKNDITDVEMKDYTTALVDPHGFLLSKLNIAGIINENIVDQIVDTFEDKNYHSYRRDYPNQSLMLSYIMMKNN
jgi:polyphenol oxidase